MVETVYSKTARGRSQRFVEKGYIADAELLGGTEYCRKGIACSSLAEFYGKVAGAKVGIDGNISTKYLLDLFDDGLNRAD